jgi:hypothetical protein
MAIDVSAKARDYILARGKAAHLLAMKGVSMC